MEQFLANIELFARAGGGGSGSGGGSGGSGGGLEALFLVGYVPMHFVGAKLRKSESKTSSVIGWLLAIFAAILCVSFIRGFVGFLIAVGALTGMAGGLYNLFGAIKQSKYVKDKLKNSAALDSAWNEEKLTEHAKQIFLRYQNDWSQQNIEAIQKYTTSRYAAHAGLLIRILQSMKRKNTMEKVEINEAYITHANDSSDDNQDSFVVGFSARAKDALIGEYDKRIFTDYNNFTEYWRFNRNGNEWLLDGIDQATANPKKYNRSIEQFANANGYFYNADMGWLFIPERGELFGEAKFGTSDINNHVVGLYKDLLVQLYSYQRDENEASKVIAQINVPKSYGNIIVRRKKKLNFWRKKGLQKVELEWLKFNQTYEVYASNIDQAASFELLNPTYMEQLVALDFEVAIEVVDNVIYLYTLEAKSGAEIYETMFDLIQKAFKEMRL